MDLGVLQAFVKHAMLGEDTPEDYHATRAAVRELFPGITKTAWSWHGFKEGLQDEGVPLSGATIGAGLGAMRGKALTGAALGYAMGSGASILRSKLRGEQPSTARKVLALSGLGYGIGGMTHAGLEHLTHRAKPGMLRSMFHGGTTGKAKFLQGVTEEGLPAIGATLGAGTALATDKHPQGQPG